MTYSRRLKFSKITFSTKETELQSAEHNITCGTRKICEFTMTFRSAECHSYERHCAECRGAVLEASEEISSGSFVSRSIARL